MLRQEDFGFLYKPLLHAAVFVVLVLEDTVPKICSSRYMYFRLKETEL
jgi:hypothetical protein